MRAVEIVNQIPAMTDVQLAAAAPANASSLSDSMESLLDHQETVFRICLGHARNYAEAEDLSQEVYLKAYQNLEGLREPSRAREWLFRIARNVCLDRQKKSRIRAVLLRRLAHESAGPADSLSDDEEIDTRIPILKKAVRSLPKKLLDVFVFREYGHLSYEDVAAILRINKGTVMSRLNRARGKIAAALKEKTDGRNG